MDLLVRPEPGTVVCDPVHAAGRVAIPPEVLVCRDRDNTARWAAGERLHHLFEQRCDLFAGRGELDHAAVESEEGVLSYGDLDRRANRLARYLIRRGLGPSGVVGLLFDRSTQCYVALLAVLKVNAAYVPLDPGFPQGRIAYIAADAGIRTILTLCEHRRALEGFAATVICLDEVDAEVAAEADGRLGEEEAGCPSSPLCYIVYTSGSTGRPKGVPIEHASICNFVRVAGEVYGYRSTDRVYQGLTIAFDFSVEEIWVPLIAGATLIPNQTGGSLLGSDLWSFLYANRVTALCCVPTLLATIEKDLPDLRLLIVSGEACPQDLVARWHHPGRTILNAYGPTEATVTATVAVLRPDEPVTIGTPLPTYSIVILSPDEGRALPQGQLGEIGIAGICLSGGYLNQEDLSCKVFIEDFLRVPNNPSGRIYRTGDLGRVNDHGQVEYHGRIDAQVKIRGYRIELTEIESVIMQLPQVAQAVVGTYEPEPGAIELVAYYTLVDGAERLGPEEVSRELRALLPSYMVPGFYERLAAIPMLPCDKADRKALPPPSRGRLHRTNGAYVAPEGDLEEGFAAILADLLQLEQVSVNDHFFDDLGANSLLMARFSAKIRRQLGITDFSMKEMYVCPSIRQLAGFLRSKSSCRVPLQRNRPNHMASDFNYYSCGTLQLLFVLGYMYFHFSILIPGFLWTLDAGGWWSAYGRATAFSAAYLAVLVGAPIALKWLLIGRWQEEEILIWSLRYFRFWVVKQTTRMNPMIAFVGSPLYIAYLKALGARIGWNSAIFSTTVPVCTDLISIGDGTVIRKDAIFPGYRAESNRIRTGPVTIGRNAFVGEGTVLDINTVMEDGTQLGHTSSLHAGQRVPAGRRYHGSPAEETAANYAALGHGRLSFGRKAAYSLAQLASLIFLYMPAAPLLAYGLVAMRAEAIVELIDVRITTFGLADEILSYTFLIYFGGLVTGLVFTICLPRLLYLLLRPGRTYKLYGIHYYIYRSILSVSNSKVFNAIFGDSSFIVHYLLALGYRFPELVQTGSNFGVEHKHDIPFLCELGRGTMVSDGLSMINADLSNTAFRLSTVRIGSDNFLGNNLFYPSQAKTGENCLFATKAMIPIDGPLREHTGLLGSPCFQIPRSVRRDKQFDKYKHPPILRQRLRLKDRSNGVTIFLYLLSNWMLIVLMAFLAHVAFVDLELRGASWFATVSMMGLLITFLYQTFVMWCVLGFKPLKPMYCSIYDEYFWKHERYWKFNLFGVNALLNGTPLKNAASRLLGVRLGRKVFDDGCAISEMTLVTIGDYCTLNEKSSIQSHSLEDGTFKSDHIVIGDGCTLGPNAFVHYGVEMGRDVDLDPDSFLMKGERPAANSCWRGNPAKEVQTEEIQEDSRVEVAPGSN